MSKYTTGELAKLCNVTVRTVQYYDKRGILIPTELSEGGRRLYSESDLQRLKVICFLREVDVPIDAISQLLEEEHPEKVISILIEQQESLLMEEIQEKQEQLEKLRELQSTVQNKESFSLESIADIAVVMKGKKQLKKLYRIILSTGLVVGVLQWVSIGFWIFKGMWWGFALWALFATVWLVWVCNYYYKHVKYICSECHQEFKPGKKEAFFAKHTPTTRNLTCSECGHKGFCIEIWDGDQV